MIHVRGAVVVDQGDQVRVQRQVAVFAELADRDVQPRARADVHHRISAQRGVLADPQARAQQHLHGDAHEQALVVLGGAQQLRGAGVVEGFGQRVVLAGQVAGEHRHPGRGLVPAPLVEADEEHPQRAQPVGDGGGGQPRLVLPGAGGEPGLVVLDVAAGHLRDAGHLGRGLGEEGGERAQRQVGAADAARPQHAADLGQVAAHRGRDLRDGGLQVGPGGQRTHSVGAPRRPVHRRLPGSARPGGLAGEDLRVDHLRGLAVLGREPVIGQVQVDAGRLDRGVPGLGLHRLQRHPGFPQPGQAGMAQLVAGRVVQAGPPPRGSQDLIGSLGRQRLPAARALEDHKDPAGAGTGRPLGVQVGGHRGEEPARDRDQPLPAALALGDEHPPLRGVQITQPQPENLTAAQPAQHHRRDHRPVPVRAQRRGQRVHLGRRQDPRQLPGEHAPAAPPAGAGTAPAGSAAPAAPD